jgi:uncharacterized YccA/Bax inhibitor family protein
MLFIFDVTNILSLTFGGIFLVVVFKYGSEKINDMMIYLLYGVFTSLTLGGIVLLLFLRMPKAEDSEKKQKLSQLELFSKV